MNDLNLRRRALELAIHTPTVGEGPQETLDRARDYYQFLSGKSPDHRPPPDAGGSQ